MLELTDISMEFVIGERTFYIIFLDSYLEMIGSYDGDHFPDCAEYLDIVSKVVKPIVSSIYDITWYARTTETSDFMEAIKLATQQKNSIIVIEYL